MWIITVAGCACCTTWGPVENRTPMTSCEIEVVNNYQKALMGSEGKTDNALSAIGKSMSMK